MSLSGKTVLVTGATSGFGHAIARVCAGAGARLVVTGRRKDRLDAMAQTIDSPIHTLHFDVRDPNAVAHAFASLPQECAAIDVLVNNAGLALGLGSFETQSLEHIEQMVDTNIKGLLYCTRAILPGMVERKQGHIVNIGSVAGNHPYPGGNTYGATKAFVRQFSLNLRADLVGKNVRVTNIEPGMAETEFSLVRFSGDQAKSDNVYKGVTPLSSEDIANTVLWCISQPAHVNVNTIELMPTQQAFAGFAVHRT